VQDVQDVVSSSHDKPDKPPQDVFIASEKPTTQTSTSSSSFATYPSFRSSATISIEKDNSVEKDDSLLPTQPPATTLSFGSELPETATITTSLKNETDISPSKPARDEISFDAAVCIGFLFLSLFFTMPTINSSLHLLQFLNYVPLECHRPGLVAFFITEVGDAYLRIHPSLIPFSGLAAGLSLGAISSVISGSPGSPLMSEANVKRLVDKLGKMRGAALKVGQFMSIQGSFYMSLVCA
jgi:hypothetical protein